MGKEKRQQDARGKKRSILRFRFSLLPHTASTTRRRGIRNLTGLSVTRIRRHAFFLLASWSRCLSHPTTELGTWARLDLRLALFFSFLIRPPFPSAYSDGWMLSRTLSLVAGSQPTPLLIFWCLILAFVVSICVLRVVICIHALPYDCG